MQTFIMKEIDLIMCKCSVHHWNMKISKEDYKGATD